MLGVVFMTLVGLGHSLRYINIKVIIEQYEYKVASAIALQTNVCLVK